MNRFKLICLTIVAVALVAFYAYGMLYAIAAARCLARTNCEAYEPGLTPGITYLLTTVGGLLSALAVAVLAITEPKTKPTVEPVLKLGMGTETRMQRNLAGAIVMVYMVAWLVGGLCSVFYGFVQYHDVVPLLTAAAKSWIGFAVAAVAAYIGINPAGQTQPPAPPAPLQLAAKQGGKR